LLFSSRKYLFLLFIVKYEMCTNVGESSVLVSEAVGILRNKETEPSLFRSTLKRLGAYLAYEASKLLEVEEKSVETPLGTAKMNQLKERIVVISILRAALPMAEGVLEQFTKASVGVVSASRGKMIEDNGKDFRIDATYVNFPYLDEQNVAIIVDPMLASGSTILYLLKLLSEQKPKKVIILCAIAEQYAASTLFFGQPSLSRPVASDFA